MNAHTALFESMFAESPDPWKFEDSWYEKRKRDLVVSSLPLPRYSAIFEPGCAGGFLSESLAPRCERLLAWDGSQRAVSLATERLMSHPSAHVEQGWIPADWPKEKFDLIVLSELLYYLPSKDIEQVALHCRSSAFASKAGITVAACHWLIPFEGAPLGGLKVHEILQEHLCLSRVCQWRDKDFCLDIWTSDVLSVAQKEHRRSLAKTPADQGNSFISAI